MFAVLFWNYTGIVLKLQKVTDRGVWTNTKICAQGNEEGKKYGKKLCQWSKLYSNQVMLWPSGYRHFFCWYSQFDETPILCFFFVFVRNNFIEIHGNSWTLRQSFDYCILFFSPSKIVYLKKWILFWDRYIYIYI